jgi:hypothetical protein
MHKKTREALVGLFDLADEEGRRAIMAFARGEAARAQARKPKLVLVTSGRPDVGLTQVRDLIPDKVQHG